MKTKQRAVARVYHLLAKEAPCLPNLHHIEDFRRARQAEESLGVNKPHTELEQS